MSNPTVQNRQGSSYKVLFPDFPSFNVTPQNITITQQFGMQDVVELHYPRFSPFYIKALKTGTPIKLTWKNDKAKGEWVGYVYDVSKNTIQSLNQPIIVRCTNTGMSFKEGGSKIWVNKTSTQVILDIAKKFKLKSNATVHKMIFSQLSLSGHTYWEKIQEIAGRVGYAAHINGTELFFHPLDKMIDKFMTTIPILSYLDDAMPPYSKVKDQTLDVFRAKLGDYSDMQDSSKRKKNVYGVDPVTGKLYSASSSPSTVGKNLRKDVKEPLFSQTVSTAVSGSKEMAKVIADAQSQFARFVHTAKGSGQGDPRMAPYRTVEINGTGQDTDGFWILKKVVHFITFDGRYTVEFECISDGRGMNKGSATRPEKAKTSPVRNVAEELATGGSSRPPSITLTYSTIMVNAVDSGFKTTPRRWVGH